MRLLPAPPHGARAARRFPSGSLAFTRVRAVPDLAPAAPLFQQAAELGLSHAAALRAIVSAAAARAGRPPLAPAPPDPVAGSMLLPVFEPVRRRRHLARMPKSRGSACVLAVC